MKLLLPALLGLVGLVGGVAAGQMMRPAPEAESEVATGGPGDEPVIAAPEPAAPEAPTEPASAEPLPGAPPPEYDPALKREYVEIERQFLVPLVKGDAVDSLMIVSLSLEMEEGTTDAVHAMEPKLRDRLLQVMFLHAQSGAFSGVFTAGPVMRDLRGALLQAAQGVLGPAVHDVLVTDILRQDL